ncbi:MAG: hypothetical protein HXX16_11550 [Bacteroidales bacterium]|nr:hypothetical protein [Bacteroidales bacterium]
MPVEIRELIIRAYVESENQKEVRTAKNASFGDEDNASSEEIIQLLGIINNKNER